MELNKLHNCDCIEFMKTLPDKSIDLVCTDPPFGVGKDFLNDEIDDNKLFNFYSSLFVEIGRITNNLIVEVPKNKLDIVFKSISIPYKYSIVLHYTNSMRNGSIGYSNYGLCLWFSYKPKCNRYKDLISEPIENTKHLFSHPSPKNVSHYSVLVNMFSDKGDTVFDPFMGSGTTAIACERLGRKWIGCEIDKKYYDIALERIERERNQLKMEF